MAHPRLMPRSISALRLVGDAWQNYFLFADNLLGMRISGTNFLMQLSLSLV